MRIFKASLRVVRRLVPRIPFEVVLLVMVLWWLPILVVLMDPRYWQLVRGAFCQSS